MSAQFPPFSTLEVGEIDNFVFDFTVEVGTASISYAVWTLTLEPFQTATDPDPQSHVMPYGNPTFLEIQLQNDTVQTIYGAFAVAQVGPCPASAAGGTYILGAQAHLTDGRIIANNNTFKLVNPGYS